MSGFDIAYHPGFACNLACDYCYQNSEGKEFRHVEGQQSRPRRVTLGPKRASVESIVQFVRERLDVLGVDTCSVTLLGGEPLLYKDDISEFMRELKSVAPVSHVLVITNGTLLDAETIDWLSSIGCNEMQITLDGWGEDHDRFRHLKNGRGTYGQVLENIKMSCSKGVDVSLRVNVTSSSVGRIYRVLDDVEELSKLGNIAVHFALINDTVGFTDAGMESASIAREYGALHFNAARRGLTVLMPTHHGNCDVCRAPANDVGPVGGMVVSSAGVLYSCWESAGQAKRDVGDVSTGYDNRRFADAWVQCGYHGGREKAFQSEAENWAFFGIEEGRRAYRKLSR